MINKRLSIKLVGCLLAASVAATTGSQIVAQSIAQDERQSTQADEGFTEPSISIIVASPESGVLSTVLVSEGDRVEAGAVLARLDSQVLQASINAAQQRLAASGKINAAKASRDNKQNRLQQMKDLLVKEHASDKEVRQAQLEFDIAEANLESQYDENRSQQMELEKIEAQLERRVVCSPINGIVLELPHKEGEAITASDSTVATIVALDRLRVRYFLTTQQAISMRRGDQIDIRFPATGQAATAAVDFISPVTDSKSGTVRVELLVENKNGEYRSGLRCVLHHPHTANQSQNRQRK